MFIGQKCSFNRRAMLSQSRATSWQGGLVMKRSMSSMHCSMRVNVLSLKQFPSSWFCLPIQFPTTQALHECL